MRKSVALAALAFWACSSKTLDRDVALRMIRADDDGTHALCQWVGVLRKHDQRSWALFVDEEKIGCITALLKTGILHEGTCISPGPNHCTDLLVTPGPGAKIVRDDLLKIEAGSISIDKVTSITTTLPNATVKFMRTATLNAELLKSLAACPLDCTEPGTLERERSFHRDDSGRWILESRH